MKWSPGSVMYKLCDPGPGWCGSVDWVPACEPKGRWFYSQSREQAWVAGWVPSGGCTWGNYTLTFLSLFLPPFPSLKINKYLIKIVWSWTNYIIILSLSFPMLNGDYNTTKTSTVLGEADNKMCSTVSGIQQAFRKYWLFFFLFLAQFPQLTIISGSLKKIYSWKSSW